MQFRIDSDISRDGIYSGIFYPQSDSEYTVNILAKPTVGYFNQDKLIQSNQSKGNIMILCHLIFMK